MNLSDIDSSKSLMQNIKQRFFALRNGMLADQLRKAGLPYSIIFGLNLPQIKEIASVIGVNPALAETLWDNSSTRESRLLAPFIAEKDNFTLVDAERWLTSLSGSLEEIDILCHGLLRHVPNKKELIVKFAGDEMPIKRYLALRLAFTLAPSEPALTAELARNELKRNCPLTEAIAFQLKDESDFLLSD